MKAKSVEPSPIEITIEIVRSDREIDARHGSDL